MPAPDVFRFRLKDGTEIRRAHIVATSFDAEHGTWTLLIIDDGKMRSLVVNHGSSECVWADGDTP